MDDNNNSVTCFDNSSSNNKLICSFIAKADINYQAVVTASRGDVQKFLIMYHKIDSCTPYSLNWPLFI